MWLVLRAGTSAALFLINHLPGRVNCERSEARGGVLSPINILIIQHLKQYIRDLWFDFGVQFTLIDGNSNNEANYGFYVNLNNVVGNTNWNIDDADSYFYWN